MNIFLNIVVCSILSTQFLSAIDYNHNSNSSKNDKFAPTTAALILEHHKRTPSDDLKPPVIIGGIEWPSSPIRK